RDLITGVGALDATLDLAADDAGKAKGELAEFPAGNSWRPALEDLADFAVSRLR
ncbi:MAG: polyprenyl synthetase family protein, partial [Phenylobacterium sp.]|nr:polyprenyl synthetase family protein [Phenylobacterium sp.]